MNEKQTKEMLEALEALMKALENYDSFREQYTGFNDLWRPQDNERTSTN